MNFLRTAFNSNLSAVAVSDSDRAALEARGITQPTLQKYVLWRRATLLVVVIFTLLSAGVTFYDNWTDDEDEDEGLLEKATAGMLAELEQRVPAAAEFVKAATPDEEDAKEDEPTKLMGRIVDGVQDASVFVLPVAALLALLLSHRLQASYRVMAAGFLFSFFLLFAVYLCPETVWGTSEPVLKPGDDPGKFLMNEAQDLKNGVGAILSLLPLVLSLVPGVVKGCQKVKSLLPQALLPGWLIVMASTLYGLFLLTLFVAVDQFTTQPYILAGFFLVVASSLVYAFRAGAFTRPLLEPADFARMKRVQLVVTLCMAGGGLLLLAYLLTREIAGMHLLGTDSDTALMRPIDVVQFLLETLSRGMFVAVVSADLFLRANLSSWQHQRALAASAAKAEYDAAMEAMEGAIAAAK
jgi:hypothetical protein